MQLHFPETQDLGVRFLAQVITQLPRGDRFVVHALHMHFIEQVLILRHKLGRVTRGQTKDKEQRTKDKNDSDNSV